MKSRRTGGQDVGTVSSLNSLVAEVGRLAVSGLAGVVAFSLYATAAPPDSNSKATSEPIGRNNDQHARSQHQAG